MTAPTETTTGTLLDGRVRYAQPAEGFRSGIEPVLLAAAIPARAGQRVLEAGSGAGAALLCLAARVPDITGVGVEVDPALAALATANATANGMAGLRFVAADMAHLPELGLFDHACANPPYHPGGGTPSPLPARARAKMAPEGLPATWITTLARHLRPRGTVSLILPAAAVPASLAALTAAHCGSAALLPLWPRAGLAAKLVILHAVRGGRGPFRLLPGLVLHAAQGFTDAAQSILRGAVALPLR